MRIVRLLIVVLVIACTIPAFGQGGRNERWVAAWAPALVARVVPGGPGAAPGGRGGAPAAPAAAPAAPAANAPAAPAVTPQAPGATGRAAAPGGRAAGPGAPAGRAGGRGGPPLAINNQTLRQIVRPTLAGERVRLVLSNVFGTAPLRIGAAHVAPRQCGDVAAGCTRTSETTLGGRASRLTVSGKEAFTIAPGAVLVTDAVDMRVQPLSDLVVDLYLPDDVTGSASPLSWHAGSSQTSYVSAPGNQSGVPAFEPAARPASWFLIARVEVMTTTSPGVIAPFGDSITDGAVSTVDTNNRWPDHLSRRLRARSGVRPFGMLNLGISGNRVLADGTGPSALARFDRDVLLQTGVTHVIILEGINDIGSARQNPSPSAQDLIDGHRQLIARARARGLTVIGGTLTPYEGAFYYTPEGEAKRTALNDWIRTSGEYDAVIDFDRITRDPANSKRFLPAYDSGDHLHPGDAGYKAMADAIDLALFK